MFSEASNGRGGGKPQLAVLAQNRIIVHTARLALVVDHVALTVNRIADTARDLGRLGGQLGPFVPA